MDRVLNFRRGGIALLALSIVSCTRPGPELSLSPAVADAVVRDSFAQFVFPLEDSIRFIWDRHSDTAYNGQPEYFWIITWEIPDERRGLDPNGLDVGLRWRPAGAQFGSLNALLRAAETTVHTECMSCDIPAYLPHRDAAVRAEAIGNRVAITIRGRAAIARIFPVRPDSVFFRRFTPHGGKDGEWTVPVRRSLRPAANTH
jgi:hypothetical protein